MSENWNTGGETTSRNYYQILGVESTVDKEEIKRAYRRLARKYHPDVNKEAGADERFKEINRAYEVLSEAETRARYDNLQAGGGVSQGQAGAYYQNTSAYQNYANRDQNDQNKFLESKIIHYFEGFRFTEYSQLDYKEMIANFSKQYNLQLDETQEYIFAKHFTFANVTIYTLKFYTQNLGKNQRISSEQAQSYSDEFEKLVVRDFAEYGRNLQIPNDELIKHIQKCIALLKTKLNPHIDNTRQQAKPSENTFNQVEFEKIIDPLIIEFVMARLSMGYVPLTGILDLRECKLYLSKKIDLSRFNSSQKDIDLIILKRIEVVFLYVMQTNYPSIYEIVNNFIKTRFHEVSQNKYTAELSCRHLIPELQMNNTRDTNWTKNFSHNSNVFKFYWGYILSNRTK